jgi:hypothetical protein
MISGPAKSTPVAVNGRECWTRCFGSDPIIGWSNVGLALLHMTHYRKTERAMALPRVGQYVLLTSARSACGPQCSILWWHSLYINLVITWSGGRTIGFFCSFDTVAFCKRPPTNISSFSINGHSDLSLLLGGISMPFFNAIISFPNTSACALFINTSFVSCSSWTVSWWLPDHFLLDCRYSTNRLSQAMARVSLCQSEYLLTRSLDSSMVLNTNWGVRCSGS